MVQVGSFWIDAFEATIEGELGHSDQGANFPDGSTLARARSLRDVVPTLRVSWYQAVAACANAGKHLCTVTEWHDACGSGTFPWGEAPRSDEVCAIIREDGTTDWDAVQPTGSLPDCRGPAGVFDQIGNAWEWADPGGHDGIPTTAKVGGAFYAGAGSGSCVAEPFDGHPPDFDGTIAARCCAD